MKRLGIALPGWVAAVTLLLTLGCAGSGDIERSSREDKTSRKEKVSGENTPAAEGADQDSFIQVWQKGALAEMQSFSGEQKIVGTHYFYWYDYPDRHFFDDAARSDDALQDHFVDPESVSYRSLAWHERELADCADAGIDFILPVYWGVVDNYFKADVVFSVEGLGPLQAAVERRSKAGSPSPKIGMFYDTTTLLPGVRGEKSRGAGGTSEKYDLRDPEGKDIFYRTIRDFFYQLHPKHWAAVDGRPLVVLYGSGFAKNHNQGSIDYVYERFQEDFCGVKPFIIKDQSWSFRADAVTAWGAALSGPRIFDRVAQIGPGYNDDAVPGRSTPIREREDGNFYRWGWDQVLSSDVSIVLIETWNEMHEGTEICASAEYGRRYIDLTRSYVDLWKKGGAAKEQIDLEHPDPVPRPPSAAGVRYRDREEVFIVLDHPPKEEGISLVTGVADGQFTSATVGELRCYRTPEASHSYAYFNVADPYYYDLREPVTIEYRIWDDGHGWHMLQYDSHDGSAALSGAYKDTQRIRCGNTGTWTTYQRLIDDARFVNRQNGGADFRFLAVDGWLAIREISVLKTD